MTNKREKCCVCGYKFSGGEPRLQVSWAGEVVCRNKSCRVEVDKRQENKEWNASRT